MFPPAHVTLALIIGAAGKATSNQPDRIREEEDRAFASLGPARSFDSLPPVVQEFLKENTGKQKEV
jgi:hypothetical protein